MKKLVAISFLFIYLFSTTALSQLLKMPLLIEHFTEHREETKDITLWQFLYNHYALGDVKDADYAQDMKLPFKSPDNCISTSSNIHLPLSSGFTIQSPKQEVTDKTFATTEAFLLPSSHSSIWHPPRVC